VPGPHGSFALPQTVSELKRILRLNMAGASAPHRKTMPTSQRSAAEPSSEHGQIARLLEVKGLPSADAPRPRQSAKHEPI